MPKTDRASETALGRLKREKPDRNWSGFFLLRFAGAFVFIACEVSASRNPVAVCNRNLTSEIKA